MFGKRYREVIRGWETSVRAGGTNDRRYVCAAPPPLRPDLTPRVFSFCLSSLLRPLAPARRINWTGAALTTFYAAVRKALVVVLVLRAIGVLVSVTVGLWWVFR